MNIQSNRPDIKEWNAQYQFHPFADPNSVEQDRPLIIESGKGAVVSDIDGKEYIDGQGGLWEIPWQLVSQNTTVDISERLSGEARRIAYEELPERIDFAFISLHGKYGDDGCIQGLLELLRLLLLVFGDLRQRLGQQLDLDAPTILVVLDRLDLIEQVQGEFASVGIAGLKTGETKEQLRRLLPEDARGVIVTTPASYTHLTPPTISPL